MERSYSRKSRYLIVLIFCIACMVIFNRSCVFFTDEMNTHKLVVIVFNVAMIGFVPIVCAFVKPFTKLTDYLMYRFAAFMYAIKMNKKKIGIYALSVIVAYVVSLFAEYCVICKVLGTSANASRQALIFAVLLLGITVYAFRKQAGERPECFFVIVALILGGMLIWVSPATLGVMVDDETHYARTVTEANYLDGTILVAEQKLRDEFAYPIFDRLAYDRESRQEYYTELNEVYASKQVAYPAIMTLKIWVPCYIPGALGMTFAKGLGLSFVHITMMGKFFNLLLYVILFYFAIKKIRYGKILLATIGLLPTNIYMAANYSYDPWLIGFVALSYAYFFYEIQTPDEPLSVKNVVLMAVFLLIGCLPKAVYCVLALPFLFMPKKKFQSGKQRFWYYAPVLLAGLALLGSFLIPALLHGVGGGDSRGGAEVNAKLQLAYILDNPMQYLRVLVNFLKDYLSVSTTPSYLQMYFYFGNGRFVGTTIVILIAVAVMDHKGENCTKPMIRISGVVASFGAAVMCATAMYISFTPVGAEHIAGCQGRYLLPMVFPFLMSIAPGKVKHEINPNVFAIVPLMGLSFTFLYNIYKLCVVFY